MLKNSEEKKGTNTPNLTKESKTQLRETEVEEASVLT